MSITETAISKLRALIVSGELPPGARLPAEPELAAQLGISRGSVREAVRALVHARMLAVRRGDGTYVTSLEPDQLLEGMTLAAELARNETVLDVVEVRRLLEPGATRIAAERITERELDELRELLERMERAEDPADFVQLDTEFHHRIATASGNAWLSSILKAIAEPTIRSRRERLRDDESVTALSNRQHRDIFHALEERDGEQAESAALLHICSTQRGLLWVLGQHPGSDAPAP